MNPLWLIALLLVGVIVQLWRIITRLTALRREYLEFSDMLRLALFPKGDSTLGRNTDDLAAIRAALTGAAPGGKEKPAAVKAPRGKAAG